ncbi:MAG: hypothetical protein ACR2H1_00295, partial [Limisphaerales bacterium]
MNENHFLGRPGLQKFARSLKFVMADSKKKPMQKPTANLTAEKSASENPPLEEFLSREQLDALSTLQLVDLIAGKLPPRHPSLMDLIYLRDRIAELEEMSDQARQAIEKLEGVIEKLRSPAFRVGTFLMPIAPDKAHVCVGGSDYVCRLDPQIPLPSLQIGQRVLCNEAFAVVQGLGFDRNGP